MDERVISAKEEQGQLTLHAIQYLRGIAALIIVLYHVFPQIERMGYGGPKPLPLSAGVDIFFVISGFVMVYSTARHPDRGAGAFLRDRLIRIAPLYWSLSLLMLVLLLIAPGIAQTSRLDWSHVIASFLFLPWMHPVQHHFYPLLVPGWSLNYEMFFYLIFAAALIVARGWRVRVVQVTCAMLVLLALLPALLPLPGVLGFYTQSLILEFSYGMLLAESFLRRPFRTSRRWWLVIAAGIAALGFSYNLMPIVPQGFAVGIPAVLIVMGALYIPINLSGRWERTLRTLGDSSYSLYLSHYMIMSAIGQVWRRLFPHTPLWWTTFAIVATIACGIVGAMVYALVEQPLTRSAKRLF